jgi:Domain of unknown function (DUF4326)
MEQMLNSNSNADVLPSASHDHKPMLAEGNFVRPVRVQRKRTMGWKMPENTVSVCRPTKWGNPFKIEINEISIKDPVTNSWVFLTYGDIDYTVWLYEMLFKADIQWVNYYELRLKHTIFQHWHDHFTMLKLSELKGKNLACFCSLNHLCHADFLLKTVNGE